jgi:hypothetical protein
MPIDDRPRPTTVARVFWVIAAIFAVFGGLTAFGGMAAANGAPQEAAAAAMGCALAVVPYVFARAIDELTKR